MASVVKVLGLSGSLRRASFNTGLLRAAATLLPADMTLEVADLFELPLFNQDLVAPDFPELPAALRLRIKEADALLLACPEYNYSVTPVLKNALDWASRAPSPPLDGKPFAIIGASPGGFGTARAQQHLRQICTATNMLGLNRPELMVRECKSKFDAAGELSDPATRELLGKVLAALGEWTRRLRGTSAYPSASPR